MRRFLALVLVLSMFAMAGDAEARRRRRRRGTQTGTFKVTVPSFPTDIQGFLALRDQLARTPEGGVAMYILAAKLYVQDEDLGIQAFAIALDRKNLEKTGGGYKGWEPKRSFEYYFKRLKDKPYIPLQFVRGTSPEAGYALPRGPYVMEMFTNPYSRIGDNALKIFVHTSGADNPKPFQVSRNNRGLWKISGGGSSLFSGVKPPAAVIDDDL